MDYRFGDSELITAERKADPAFLDQLNRQTTRRGVVGIIERSGRFLVIRRSKSVIAPLLLALPGGGIEPGETKPQALIREFTEELGVACEPIEEVLESITPWGVYLSWWTARYSDDQIARLSPSKREVAEIVWLSLSEIKASPDKLASMNLFVDWLESGVGVNANGEL